MSFKSIAKEVCNGCDLVTSEENKLSTDDVVAADVLTLDDFALCVIEDKPVGVVTFEEFPERYYWGGQSLTNMVVSFIENYETEQEAREAYAKEKKKDAVRMKISLTKTKKNQDFVQVTIV